MPYFITQDNPECAGWAVEKEDGEMYGCHTSKAAAIDQMVAISLEEGIEPGGERTEQRVDNVPQYIQDAAARGLELNREGFGGDGLTDQTLREARAMARGEMSDDKVIRANAWAARHANSLQRPQNSDDQHPDWPGPGAVSHYLWGINPLDPAPARRWLERQAENVQQNRDLPDNYRPALEPDVPEGRACGNCAFYDETMVDGDRAWCERWDEYVRGDHYCNAWQQGERSAMTDMEIRTIETEPIELRAAEDGEGMTFTGFAARYDVPSLPLPFVERIAPGAFRKTLRSRNDIRMYVNHDDRMVLGSTRAKTLRLEDRTDGLFVEADLPETSYGRDLSTLISRGDVRTMSFGFSTVKDAWSADGAERTLTEVRLHEVSVVTGVAAYPQTSASVRNLRLIAKRTETDADALTEAIGALEAGETLNDDQADLLRTVVDRAHGLAEPAEPAEPTTPLSVLASKLDLHAKQLKHL